MKQKQYNSICMNLCNFCNLQCVWCYKQCKKRESLNWNFFLRFYEKVIQNHIENITLIGGEPTIYPDFLELLKVLKEQKIYINTNGIMFADDLFCDLVIHNIEGLTVALKGYDRFSFIDETGKDKFDKLQKAIKNIQDRKAKVSFTYNCTNIMNDKQCEMFVKFLVENNIKEIVLHDLRPYVDSKGEVVKKNSIKALQDLAITLENYPIKTFVRLNQPFCFYDQFFIEWAMNKNLLISTCAVKKAQGFFLTHELDLIPCNELEDIKFGTFIKDFSDYEEMLNIFNTKRVIDFYKKMSGLPQNECISCSERQNCGGSCILHWIQ